MRGSMVDDVTAALASAADARIEHEDSPPDLAHALRRSGETLLRAGRFKDALELLKEAQPAYEKYETPMAQAELGLLLGTCLSELGQVERAFTVLTTARARWNERDRGLPTSDVPSRPATREENDLLRGIVAQLGHVVRRIERMGKVRFKIAAMHFLEASKLSERTSDATSAQSYMRLSRATMEMYRGTS